MNTATPIVTLAADMLPSDGRFGSGPSRLRPEQLTSLTTTYRDLLGTSHRQAPVKALVGSVQRQLLDLFDAPDGYEVVMGNGGAAMFWDVAAESLIEHRAQCLNFGAFGKKFARAAGAPWLETPSVRSAPHGTLAAPVAEAGIDVYAWPHNDTSTGVLAPVERVTPASEALTLIDATSAAGGITFDAANADVYYFAPQKNLGSDGGLWVALLSPAAIERAERIAASGRHIPDSLNLHLAITNSRSQQTVNTPSLVTLALLETQLQWIIASGGLTWAESRARESSEVLYRWAERSDFATPFVADPAHRSPVNATIEFADDVDARELSRQLRAHGIVDVDAYSGIGHNQLRIATYVSVEPDDVRRLTECIDAIVGGLRGR